MVYGVRYSSKQGFSLIEVCIALIIIGLLLGAALETYKLYQIKHDAAVVESRLEVVQSALSRYVYRYGRYPLPAPRDAALGSATVGREVSLGSVVTCPSPSTPTGSVCRTPGVVNLDGVPGNDGVLIGDVPFATLGIRYDNIVDVYGAKLIYAVSENLTTPAAGLTGYHEGWGAIEVNTSAGTTVFTGAGTPKAHYVVVSTGENRRGAFGLGGTLIFQCTGVGKDISNCNTGSTFVSNVDFSSAPTAYSYGRVLNFLEPGANYFDDKMVYTNSTSFGIWTKVPAPVVGQVSIANTNAQNIKIGAFANPTACGAAPCTNLPYTKVDVEGSVRATEIDSSRWCGDYGASGCIQVSTPLPYGVLSPETLGGNPITPGVTDTGSGRFQNNGGGILCASNMALRGFYRGDEVCSQTVQFTPSTSVGACSAGHYAVGLNRDGTLCCDDTLPCH